MSAEHPIASVPTDGRPFDLRVGRRWFRGAWREDRETGAVGLHARIGGDEWWPVAPEAWREIAPPRPQRPPRPTAPPARLPQADPGEPPPPISYPDLVTRVTRMVLTLRALRDPEWRFLSAGGRVNWPTTTDSAEEKRWQRENGSNLDPRPARFEPTPRDLAQLDEAVAWFQALEPLSLPMRRELIRLGREPLSPPQRLVWLAARGISFHSIAKAQGEHHETIRRRTNVAWERLWRIACARLGDRSDVAAGAARRQPARPAHRRA